MTDEWMNPKQSFQMLMACVNAGLNWNAAKFALKAYPEILRVAAQMGYESLSKAKGYDLKVVEAMFCRKYNTAQNEISVQRNFTVINGGKSRKKSNVIELREAMTAE